jgi:hypothetical protein
MTSGAPRFAWSDAWLLLAIGYAAQKGPSRLPRVIAAGDYIQHAIMTWEEVDGGLHRLGDAGLVKVRNQKILLTPKGRRLINKLRTLDGR